MLGGNMNFETTLLRLPPREWAPRQAVIFDWYDGPREGVIRLDSPDCEFSFELLSEQPTADDLDDRLFRVAELPRGTVSKVLSAIRVLGEPAGSVWIPIWKFTSDPERLAAEQRIRELIGKQRETDLIVWTRDMKEFLGCWNGER